MSYSSFASVYDKLTFNVEYEKRAEYIHSLLKGLGCNEGAMLDLACGTGSLSQHFVPMGYDMILVDSSPEMLSFAREKLPGALILCQDMRELDLYGTIDCAVCSLDSLNHLLRAGDIKRVFSKISLFTRPGGAFVFDVNTTYKHEKILGSNTFVYEKENVYCVWQNSYKPKTNRVDINLDLFINENGAYTRYSDAFSERAYELSDIKLWLEEAGFAVKGIYHDMTNEECGETTQRAYFAAIKA